MVTQSDGNMSNAAVAAFGSFITWISAFMDPSTITFMSALLLPRVFFIIGKVVDVFLKIYLEKKAQELNWRNKILNETHPPQETKTNDR